MRLCKHEGCTNEATFGLQCQPCRNSVKRYKITTPQKLALLKEQNDQCFLCDSPVAFDGTSRNAVVDHCHKEGHIRKILCANCNVTIGYLENKNINLDRLKEYLG